MIALAGFFVGLGLALVAGALYRLAQSVTAALTAPRPAMPTPAEWADNLAILATRTVDAWWNQARYAPEPAPSTAAMPVSAIEMQEELAAAVGAGVEQLRELYREKGVAKSERELTEEALDFLRTATDGWDGLDD